MEKFIGRLGNGLRNTETGLIVRADVSTDTPIQESILRVLQYQEDVNEANIAAFNEERDAINTLARRVATNEKKADFLLGGVVALSVMLGRALHKLNRK